MPAGHEIKQIDSTHWELVENSLPKTWEEFCEKNLVTDGEYYMNNYSDILTLTSASTMRNPFGHRNLLPNLKTAKAMRALCQLIQLRDRYNGDWKPTWSSEDEKYTIAGVYDENEMEVKVAAVYGYEVSRVLTFKTKELRDQFLKNFRDLIEIAKPLL